MANEQNNSDITINWARLSVYDEHGRVDEAKTLERIAASLREFVETNQFDFKAVENAVSKALNDFGSNVPMKTITIDSLALRALRHLTIPNGSEVKAMEAIKNFVRGESKVFEASNGEKGLLHSRKGMGCRVATQGYREMYKKELAEKAAKNQSNG